MNVVKESWTELTTEGRKVLKRKILSERTSPFQVDREGLEVENTVWVHFTLQVDPESRECGQSVLNWAKYRKLKSLDVENTDWAHIMFEVDKGRRVLKVENTDLACSFVEEFHR